MRKFVISGPESTGKTSLAKALAQHYQTDWVAEYARQFIDNLDRPYQKEDLLDIAKGQVELQKNVALTSKNEPGLICDTDLMTIKIWSEYKYRACDPLIIELLEQNAGDFYFLCGPDLPWEADPQRENPENRMELYLIYKKELEALDRKYVEIWGPWEERVKKAIFYIDNIFEPYTNY